MASLSRLPRERKQREIERRVIRRRRRRLRMVLVDRVRGARGNRRSGELEQTGRRQLALRVGAVVEFHADFRPIDAVDDVVVRHDQPGTDEKSGSLALGRRRRCSRRDVSACAIRSRHCCGDLKVTAESVRRSNAVSFTCRCADPRYRPTNVFQLLISWSPRESGLHQRVRLAAAFGHMDDRGHHLIQVFRPERDLLQRDAEAVAEIEQVSELSWGPVRGAQRRMELLTLVSRQVGRRHNRPRLCHSTARV
jgi:hypothetical protein